MKKLAEFALTLLLVFSCQLAYSSPVFIENKGQWNSDVLFAARLKGMSAWIKKDGVVFDFYKTELKEEHTLRTGHVVAMNLVNISNSAFGKPLKQSSGCYNYFIGNNSANWQSKVRLFEEVVIENVYPGIGIRYYFEGGFLRYDFILQAGADPSQIAFKINGCDSKLDRQLNSLVFHTQVGEIRQKDLLTYQIIEGRKRDLRSKFVLEDDVLKIDVEEFNPASGMVIDPLIFSTFIGGEASDYLYDLKKDASGNLVVCGESAGFGFPSTSGAYSIEAQSSTDAYISKFSADGSQLIFSTFFGGTEQETCQGLALDANDNIFIIGSTASDDLPTTSGVFQEEFNVNVFASSFDIFVTKLNSTGSALIYSTYLGDDGMDFGQSIAVDENGNAYVAGSSKSFDFPTTTGAFDESYNGEGWNNVVVSKLNPSGSSLIYSTYVGGSSGDDATKIALGTDGSAFITGTAFSANFPTTPGSIKPVKTGNRDAFVFRLNPSGSSLIYSTFVGGNSLDDGYSIAVDQENNAYVTGLTISPDFPVTSGVFSSTAGDQENVFVSKINPSGSAYLFSGLMGGNSRDVGHHIAIGSDNTILLSGETNSSTFQVSSNAYMSTFQGIVDAFVAKISLDGSQIIYSSYFGGNSVEIAYAILDDGADKLIVAGVTGGGNFPTTTGAYDISHNSGNDSFISKISLICQPIGLNATSNSPVCAGQDLVLNGLPVGMVSYSWSGPGKYFSANQNAILSNVNPENSGQYIFTSLDSDGCEGSITLNVEVIDVDLQVVQDETSLVAQQAGASYQWLDCNQNFSALAEAQGQSFLLDGTGSYAVEITLEGCKDTTECFLVAGLNPHTTSENHLLVHPNPAKDWVQFQQLQGTAQLKIFDLNGRLIKMASITQEQTLNVSDLASGMYLIQIQTSANQLKQSKLMIH